MKTGIYSYITFSGNCREAMQFYKQCLGGTLRFQTVGNVPALPGLPLKIKNRILHAELRREDLVLLGTDLSDSDALIRGNAVSLLLSCATERQLRSYYTKLSAGGIRTYPPVLNNRGIMLGNLTDKYGHHWLLHFAGAKQKK